MDTLVLINGFCASGIISFSIVRAMSSIGAALVIPNVVAIIGITFPPGSMRNLSFGLFGFGAPVGGTVIEWAEWKCFFFSV